MHREMKCVFIAAALLSAVLVSQAFSVTSPRPLTQTQTNVWRTFAAPRPTTDSTLAESEDLSLRRDTVTAETDNVSETAPVSKRQQLWLDLRGIAMGPTEAIKFLDEVLQDDEGNENASSFISLIDWVLLSEEVFFKFLSSGAVADVGVLYVTDDGDLIADQHETQQSFLIGRIVRLDPDELLDPLVAIEGISNGEWLLLEPAESMPDNNMVKAQVSGLLDLVSSPASYGVATSPLSSTFIVPSMKATADLRGGIAIYCDHKSRLLEMDALLAQSHLCVGMTVSTESGILVPTGLKPSANVGTALVLPLDVMLWKTVLDLNV